MFLWNKYGLTNRKLPNSTPHPNFQESNTFLCSSRGFTGNEYLISNLKCASSGLSEILKTVRIFFVKTSKAVQNPFLFLMKFFSVLGLVCIKCDLFSIRPKLFLFKTELWDCWCTDVGCCIFKTSLTFSKLTRVCTQTYFIFWNRLVECLV